MMPKKSQRVYSKLLNMVRLVNTTWAQYKILFGDAENTDVMNKIAPFHFHELQRLMVQDVILGLCRLMDPAQSPVPKRGIVDNCSLRQLECVGNKKLEAIFAKATSHVNSLKSWRDRHYAHSDLETMEGVVALPALKRSKIESTIASINAILSLIIEEHLQETHSYVIVPIGGAESLIGAIREVSTGRAEKRKKLGSL